VAIWERMQAQIAAVAGAPSQWRQRVALDSHPAFSYTDLHERIAAWKTLFSIGALGAPSGEYRQGVGMVDAQVLVLNRSWIAVNVTPVKRALCLLFQEQARVVHPKDFSIYDFESWCALSQQQGAFQDGHFIHSPKRSIRLPEVIVLRHFNGFIQRKLRLSRRNIFERDRNICQYCGHHFTRSELTLDHVLPRCKGGRDSWDNLVLACMPCNLKKGGRTPKEAHMKLLRAPIKPKWVPRFGAPIPHDALESWQRFVDTAYWNTEIGD
jgi:5-methylcytosine-specific restriction endonuclease McrA